MSRNFGDVDLVHLQFPAIMRIDYIRVYQPKNAINIGCDPKNFPTAAYINQYVFSFDDDDDRFSTRLFPRYLGAYTNPNLTTWKDDFKQPWPKNRFLGEC